MRKFTLLVAALAMFTSFNASAETVLLGNPNKVKQNILEGKDFVKTPAKPGAEATEEDQAAYEAAVEAYNKEVEAMAGWKVQCMNTEKNIESGNTITTPDANIIPMKFSNGAEHIVTLPEGFVATKVTLYTVINKDAATNRPAFWKKVNEHEFTAETGKIATSYKDFENPDAYEFTIAKASNVSITNSGEQPFVAILVEYEKGEPAGIENVIVAEDENAPMYNLQGVQVDENYKGIVIKNGKKFINK